MRVLLVGTITFLDRCQEILQFQTGVKLIGKTSDTQDAREIATEMEPDLILVEDCLDVNIVGRLSRSAHRSVVILASTHPTIDSQRRAAGVGIHKVIQYPFSPQELLETFDAVRTTTQQRVTAEDEFGDESELDVQIEPRGGFIRQEVIVVHSPKGGVGKTTIALNLAAQYRKSLGPSTRVLLIDLDPFGNLIGYLRMEGHGSIEKWALLERDPSLKEIEEELTCFHPETGIRVIPAPKMVYSMRSVESAAIERILAVARNHFDVIVIDLSPMLMDAQIIALEHATRVIEVVIPEVPTLRALNEFRGLLDRLLDVNQANIGLILNRIPETLKKPFKSVREIEEYYLPPWPILAKIPDSDEVAESINSFRPAIHQFPDGEFASQIKKLVGVQNNDTTKRTPFGWFKGMLGR